MMPSESTPRPSSRALDARDFGARDLGGRQLAGRQLAARHLARERDAGDVSIALDGERHLAAMIEVRLPTLEAPLLELARRLVDPFVPGEQDQEVDLPVVVGEVEVATLMLEKRVGRTGKGQFGEVGNKNVLEAPAGLGLRPAADHLLPELSQRLVEVDAPGR